MPRKTLVIIFLLLSTSWAEDRKSGEAVRYWPQWRGPLGTGVAPEADPPVHWSESRNLLWKKVLPGLGHSTPILWGHRIFVTAAVPTGDALKPVYDDAPGSHGNLPVTHRQRFVVLALDRGSGKVLWERTVHTRLPHEGGHYTSSLASASPITDGEHLLAYFGSQGIYCFSLEGELQWEKQMGTMRTKHGHGEGSSPVLYGETLVINWDHEGQSFVVALDKRTGKELWKVPRNEVTSWATPIAVEQDGMAQVIVAGTSRVRGYHLETGEVIWECGGLAANIVASPVAGDGMAFVGSSYDKRVLLAIRLSGARGDITGTDRVPWTRRRTTPYVPSPLLYDGILYFLAHYQSVLTRVDARTGRERPGPLRLPGIGNVYASPVAAADRIYVTDLSGATLVLSHSETPEALAVNRLEDSFSASVALAGRQLYLRGEKNLYAIGPAPAAAP